MTLPAGKDPNMNHIDMKKRRKVMLETLQYLCQRREEFRRQAEHNFTKWESDLPTPPRGSVICDENAEKDGKYHYNIYTGTGIPMVFVTGSDWGITALHMTKRFGKKFVVLNMANAELAGGGYVEGHPAMEENLFRRTDCHFFLNRATQMKAEDHDLYSKDYTNLLEGRYKRGSEPSADPILNDAEDGQVYLDPTYRVCFRGPEDRIDKRFGYKPLPLDLIFPFYEMRAAALDHRDGRHFNRVECKRRVKAQFETLKAKGKRHVILSAFGCGAFLAPPSEVAEVYAELVYEYRFFVDIVVFAILYQGYGPDNFTPFQKVFDHRDWTQEPVFDSGEERIWQYLADDGRTWKDYPEADSLSLEIAAAHYERQTDGVSSTVHVTDEDVVDIKTMMQVRTTDHNVKTQVRRKSIPRDIILSDFNNPVKNLGQKEAEAAARRAREEEEAAGTAMLR